MARKVWTADEVEVDVSGLFTTYHRLLGEAVVLGEFTFPAFSTSGIFNATDGRELVVKRTSWWRGWHEMREGGIVLGTACPRGFWRRTMSVGFLGAMYELAPAGFWSRAWNLIDEAGMPLLEIRPRGIFRRGAYLTILGPVQVDLLVFTYYLVNVRWQEQSATASTTAAAGS